MKYPNPIKKGSVFGITAPSGGVNPRLHPRLDLGINFLKSMGYVVKEGKCLKNESKHVSAPKEDRAEDFMNMYLDDSIDAIYPPWGGELLIEILPLLDFKKLESARPKWIIGYSDTSTLLLPITLKLDVSTVHGINLMDTIPQQSDRLSRALFDALKTEAGNDFTQQSADRWQNKWTDFIKNPEAPFNFTEPVRWKRLGSEGPTNFSGRLLGGCLDTLGCILGTEFANADEFKSKYRSDGIILFLENCELEPPAFIRFIYNLRLSGWMDEVNGMLIGRSAAPDTKDENKLSYKEALQSSLGDLDFPILFDADIGHCPPQMNLLNGALAEIKYDAGKAEVTQHFV